MVNNDVVAFHTIARKYLMDRIEELTQDRDEFWDTYKDQIQTVSLNSQRATEFYKEHPTLDIRIEMLKNLLNEVETINSDNLTSIYQIKNALLVAAHKASIPHFNPLPMAGRYDIMYGTNDEKQNFRNIINYIPQEQLNTATHLPHRRVLSTEEIVKVEELFQTKWPGIIDIANDPDNKDTIKFNSGYFFENANRHIFLSEDVIQFESEYFYNKVEITKLIEILKMTPNNELIYMIDTFNLPPISYLMDVSLLSWDSVLGDGFWSSRTMEWAIYKDHEGNTLVCSKWLIQELCREYHDLII